MSSFEAALLRLALAEPLVLRHGLFEVINPRGQVRITIRFEVPATASVNRAHDKTRHSLVDVGGRGEVRGVTANVLHIRVLVHPNPVDLHDGRECEMVQVDVAEVPRHAKIGDEVHWLLGHRTRSNLYGDVGSHAWLVNLPGQLRIRNPADVLWAFRV